MLLTCISNQANDLPDEFLDARRGYGRDETFPLTVGVDYVAFALTTYLGGLWAYVIDDDDHAFPVWKPMPLFEIRQGAISSTWVAGQRGEGDRYEVVLSFPEWAQNPNFYERLVEGEEVVVSTFERYRTVLHEEHDMPSFPPPHDAR